MKGAKPKTGPFDLDLLAKINREVNRAIRFIPDLDDDWNVPGMTGPGDIGDCEDHAFKKMADLMEAGYPAGALHLALCHTREGAAHAVLDVETETGDLILDNLYDHVVGCRLPRYQWLARSIPGEWFWWEKIT